MKWVTRKGVKFDRTACAWAIKRFIDPEAEFGFLSGDEMPAAIDAGATPFHNYAWTGNPADVPTDRVNFPRLLELYGLDGDPALVKFGELVKKAEKSGWAKDGSEQYSLFAIAYGISRQVDGDDGALTERIQPVYDALYSFCQGLVQGDRGWMSDKS